MLAKSSTVNTDSYFCACPLHEPKFVSRRTWFRHQAREHVDNPLLQLQLGGSSTDLSEAEVEDNDLSSEMSITNYDDSPLIDSNDTQLQDSNSCQNSPFQSDTLSSRIAHTTCSSPLMTGSSPHMHAFMYQNMDNTIDDDFSFQDGGFLLMEDDGIPTILPIKYISILIHRPGRFNIIIVRYE
jgi:hypothetical protein